MVTTNKAILAYLKELTPERRELVQAIREVMTANMDPRFEAGMQYGMPAWFLPHSDYPAGYHCKPEEPLPFASVASQKSHVGIYLFCLYFDPSHRERFVSEWKTTGCRLDMGKSCVRVKKLDQVPLDAIGRAIKRMTAKKFVKFYEASLSEGASKKRAKKL
ncbi:MAG: DUF1801 domain-containing protein [bacterium]|nr:DUF1801 domain-containing protein [Planctomycetota bacterium]HIL52371.1 DUF1801 domain-containing protein [Planctomycetota bacterium]